MEEEKMGIFIDNCWPRAYLHCSRILALNTLLMFLEKKWKTPHDQSSMLSVFWYVCKEQIAK